ncbi:metabolite traffic protein EboE [soil metagenome]
MKLPTYPDCHLTYCTNIHPGETWGDHFSQLKIYLPELKKRLSPDESFGIGLRLSATAAEQLLKKDTLNAFRNWLDNEDLYLFTINGFPYGSFHGERVKDNVYTPDWSKRDRVEYTLNLIKILSELLPDDMDGGISTSPISYKYWSNNKPTDELFKISARHLAETAHAMAETEKNRGKELHLDIEPEPDCLLENSSETIDFFTNWLFPIGSDYLVQTHGYSRVDAAKKLRRHIRVCYDTCHFALEYENPHKAIDDFIAAGIQIGKTQVSAALKVILTWDDSFRKRIAARLQKFDEPVYLHQVIARTAEGAYKQFRDIPQAIGSIYDKDTEEWRIHFHVPVFIDQFDEMSSTQDHILNSLKPLLERSGCKHFEIETYTWEVLPDQLKTDLKDSIEREFNWTLNAIEELN